jgi:hypothetical protein
MYIDLSGMLSFYFRQKGIRKFQKYSNSKTPYYTRELRNVQSFPKRETKHIKKIVKQFFYSLFLDKIVITM